MCCKVMPLAFLFFLLLQQVIPVAADARPAPFSRDPLGKRVVKAMDALVSGHVAWNDWPVWNSVMSPYWVENFIYDTVDGFPDGGNFTGLRHWYDGEHIPYNEAFWPVVFTQMIFLAEEKSASTTTYANAKWIKPLGQLMPGAAKDKHVHIRICDFYRLVPDNTSSAGGRIQYNWMMIDMVGLLLQAGHRVLPESRLDEGTWVQPPNTMDGLPAPASFFVNSVDTEMSRASVNELLQHEWVHQKGASPNWANSMIWYGPAGIGVARNRDQYQNEFIQPVYKAFANLTLQVDVVSCEGNFCAAHGYLHGVHVGEWLGQEATGKEVGLRFGSHWHFSSGSIIEGWTMMDLPALFKQFGVDLFKRTSFYDEDSRGVEVLIE